jgi:RNA polymerase sigma-70 factor (ECF subfamily)
MPSVGLARTCGSEADVTEASRSRRFEQVALPHLDAAYNLARWLTRNDHDAEDVVQEAYLRAYRYFDGFNGGNGRAWLLAIVRRTCFTWLGKNRPSEVVALDEDGMEAIEARTAREELGSAAADNPETHLLKKADRTMLTEAIGTLPAAFREALVLREFEELAYQEIAEIAGVPIGTVMSRLARARRLLKETLVRQERKEQAHGL